MSVIWIRYPFLRWRLSVLVSTSLSPAFSSLRYYSRLSNLRVCANVSQAWEPYTMQDIFECQHGFHSYGH